MRLVVSDTGPVHYLVLIGHIDLLPLLFEQNFIPPAVLYELSAPNAPALVRQWISSRPSWLKVQQAPPRSVEDTALDSLDEGESEAIRLAAAVHADLVLVDDRAGVKAALARGLNTTGTLGVLDLAARRGLLDLTEAFARLRQTNFHCPEKLMQRLLDEHTGRGTPGA